MLYFCPMIEISGRRCDVQIYCCGCSKKIDAKLTSGREIYPHRPDLSNIPLWKCGNCGNYVGCHHKTSNPTQPLGCIPTPDIMAARKKIHAYIDPFWKSGQISRSKLYAMISTRLGYKYHTANIRTIDEADKILAIAKSLFEGVLTWTPRP